jgi:hypothetical protein
MTMSKRDLDRLTAALVNAGAAGLTQNDIYHSVFGRNRSGKEVAAMLSQLEAAGQVRSYRIAPTGGSSRRPTTNWRIKALTRDPAPSPNGIRPDLSESPPAGEGWLPVRDVMFRATRGVMPAHAMRVGKRLRVEARKRQKTKRRPEALVSDERRGGRHLAGLAYRNYRHSGVIEERDGWVRLARNPVRRPPHHWHEALLMILAAAHPSLDGRWHPTPKRTVRTVAEGALGRQLEPDEYVRRKPGRAGSWDPEDIDVMTRLRPDRWTAEGLRALADRLEERNR